MNARQKRLFEEARKRNPDLKIPSETQPPMTVRGDLALIKQGVGDKSSKPATPAAATGDATGEAPSGEQRRQCGHSISRPRDSDSSVPMTAEETSSSTSPVSPKAWQPTFAPARAVLYELGMDRTGKMAASSLRIPPPAAAPARNKQL